MALLAIGLGVGLGIGLRHDEASPPSGPTTSTPTTPASLTISSPSTTSTPTLKSGILNDTSLAAVTSPDGNRHVFFQDFKGSLRHTVFDQAANSWTNEPDNITTSSAPRLHTPLAAISIKFGGSGEIHVFFLNTDGFVTAALYVVDSGFIGSPNPMNNTFLAAADTRTLSISSMSLSENGTVAEAILLYEAPSGNITTLRGYFSPGDSTTNEWLWQNVSEAIYSSFDNVDTWLSPPLGSDCFILRPSQMVYFGFFNPNAISNSTASPLYFIQFNNWTGSRKYSGLYLLRSYPVGAFNRNVTYL